MPGETVLGCGQVQSTSQDQNKTVGSELVLYCKFEKNNCSTAIGDRTSAILQVGTVLVLYCKSEKTKCCTLSRDRTSALLQGGTVELNQCFIAAIGNTIMDPCNLAKL